MLLEEYTKMVSVSSLVNGHQTVVYIGLEPCILQEALSERELWCSLGGIGAMCQHHDLAWLPPH